MGYTTIGGRLSAETQRDFRVRNNFTDTQSNDNTEVDLQYPGWDGAEMACWKGAAEWGSIAHGDGSGDPTQTTIGSGGANFDFFYAGAADGIGDTNHNIISRISTCGGGGTLAYTETPISNGWRIRFCDEWTWYDGPDATPTGGTSFDIQGVGCHELGHALGLGHSADGNATMYAASAGSGTADRSINSDDQAGVQFIYGAMAGTKPIITAANLNPGTGIVTITGSNFSTINGEVWFTNRNSTGIAVDPRVRVTGVSSSGGGTQIAVSLPANAGHGEIAVKQSTTGHTTLSNAFPFDTIGDSGAPLTVIGTIPSPIENLQPGTAETITVLGAGFSLATEILIDGNPIAGTYTVLSETQITFDWFPLSSLGAHTLEVVDGLDSDSITIDVVANTTPTLQVGTGDPGNVVSFFAVCMLAGPVGSIQYFVASPSSIPSVLPGMIELDMGNVFQELYEIGVYVIPATGSKNVLVSLGTLSDITLYWQTLNIDLPIATGWPMEDSNLQSTYTP
jgi:hypothetical protein